MSSLVPSERGFLWDLHTVVYGDAEKDRKPVQTFLAEVNKYPGLLDIMMGIEGLVSRRGSHASGVILFDEDPFEFGCFMKTPSGEMITQYDLHKCEAAGMTKYDFLLTKVQDKLVQAIELLQEDGQIEKDLSLREVYDKYFHPSVLPMEDKEIWKNIQDVNIIDLFQFDSDVGAQAAKKIKPTSILELADANGLMRLMTSEKGAEMPIDKYVRFKNNIELWYDEMRSYGLTENEQEILKPHFLRSHGVPPSQEQLMTMLMDEKICHFSLKDANAARKIVGKKQMSKIPALKNQVMEQAASPALGRYVWDCGIGPQMGYSFSIIHALAYSFIGYQTAYIATKWNPIYWNTATLIINSMSSDDDDDGSSSKKNKSSDYGKIAKAIGIIRSRGINVSLININTSDYGFKPDVANNRILYGLKAISHIGDDVVDKIKDGRPYIGIKDFMNRCPLPKTAMINLIKSGAFDEIDSSFDHNRAKIMTYYILKECDAKKKLTMQNFNGLIQHGLIPEELELQVRVFNFNKYLKRKGNTVLNWFGLDDASIAFLERFFPDALDAVNTYNSHLVIDKNYWDKIYQTEMLVAKAWLKDHHDEVLNKYNEELFFELWNKYANGTLSSWEMDSLCFYHSPHELAQVDIYKYGISNFENLPTEPEVDYFWKRGNAQIPIYKLTRIIGTVVDKNDSRSSITLLTTTGVVSVKFTREYYSLFKKQISQIQPDGSKKVIERSWFKKGSKLMVTGFRREDTFVAKNYSKSGWHQLYKIDQVLGSEVSLRHERYSSNNNFEEDDSED